LSDAIVSLPLLWGLILLAAIDIRTYTLPDAITLPLLTLGLVLSALGIGPPMIASVAGVIVGYAGLALTAVGYRYLRGRDGLGLGDAKLLSLLGAWTGAALLPQILLIAALLGLVLRSSASEERTAPHQRCAAVRPFPRNFGVLCFRKHKSADDCDRTISAVHTRVVIAELATTSEARLQRRAAMPSIAARCHISFTPPS
jgi:Flp pilus assembly protein protease CpaA